MLTCYAEKRACYSLISYKTKKHNPAPTEVERRYEPFESGGVLHCARRCTTSGGCRFCTDRSRAETSNVRVRRSPSLRETGCWKSIGLPLAPTEVERRYEPFESGRTRLYTKGILLGYLLYRRRARDGTRTRDPDLGKVVLHQLSHSRIINKIFIFKAGDGNRTHVFSLEG